MYLALKNALGKSFILFSGLLNKFSGASAAYSLRRLGPYNGPAVRIRRASDATEVNVGFNGTSSVDTTSPITVVSGSTTATTLGAFLTEGGNQDATVHTWYDQSGNANDATQTTIGDQPSIAESGNLINGLKFSGDGSTQTDFLKTDLVTNDLGTEFCLGVVGTIESTHSSTARHSVFGNTKQVGAYPNGKVAIAVVPATGSYRFTNENGAETSVINSSAVGANTEAIVLANYDDASVKIRVNGSETTGTITSPNLNDSTTTIDIMRAKFNNSITRQQNSPEGTVRELLVYPSNQSSTLEGIETNINNYYSTF